MATDYDAPRRGDVDELSEDSLDELKARRAEAQSGGQPLPVTEVLAVPATSRGAGRDDALRGYAG